MTQKLLMATALIASAITVQLQAGEETAWSRKSTDSCKQETAKRDESTFVSKLSPYSYKQWENFTPAQKNAAMDYADANKMAPDEAVDRVVRTM
jgi:hypothetical protein